MIEDTIFRNLTDCAMEMILAFNESGKIVYANKTAKEMLEYDDGLIDVWISEVFPKEIDTEPELVFHIKTNCIVESMMAYRGNRTCFAVDGKVVTIVAGKLYAFMVQDSTQKNYYEKKANLADVQIGSANQVKTQFVANVTHELRTPVNGILGNTRELAAMENDPDKQKILNLIERGCNNMHSIINNILDFSKLEAGKFDLEKNEFDFFSMVDYVKSNHQNRIIEKGLNFEINISPEIPQKLIGDELRIVQILNNLLSNAVKFTSTGKITLEAVKTAQLKNRIELFFMVIDTGIGISKENQDKLFKSFSQAEASTTRKYGGTGLGLYISKQLVELMEGNIHLESELNKGTMFSFHIWLELAEKDGIEMVEDKKVFDVKIPSLSDFQQDEQIFEYGSAENMEELQKKMNKLILSVEMRNWEKAELFMESIKQLTAMGTPEVKSATLRLKMAVQKGDYDKTVQAFAVLKKAVES